ncbi:MAG: hypothetical protein F6K04_24205 [Leptolyngbya sp. SIO4C5]|nr:hypothetical protein [Leptolyngbya sp. SIO4C5]
MSNLKSNLLLETLEKIWQPRDRIAMLHYGRCGSTVLGDLLGQHPDIFWDSEVFERLYTQQLWESRWLKEPLSLLRLRVGLAWLTRRQCYGFETKCHPAYHLRKAILNTVPAQ